jgi:hypothetical protein
MPDRKLTYINSMTKQKNNKQINATFVIDCENLVKRVAHSNMDPLLQ